MALLIALLEPLEREVAEHIYDEGGAFEDDGTWVSCDPLNVRELLTTEWEAFEELGCATEEDKEPSEKLLRRQSVEVMKALTSLYDNGCVILDLPRGTVRCTKKYAAEAAWQLTQNLKQYREYYANEQKD